MITSRANPLIKEIKKLRDAGERAARGLFIVEGDRFVSDLSAKGLTAEYIFSVDESAGEKLAARRFFAVSDAVLSSLSELKTPQHTVAVYRLPIYREDDIYACRRILLLDGVQNPDNGGALVRSAVCAGFDAVVCINGCADLYSPKSVRASAGAISEIVTFNGTAAIMDGLCERGFTVIGTSLAGKDAPSAQSPPFALVIGSEGGGMSAEAAERCTLLCRLPMRGKCESLNAACAGTLMMYKINAMI